MYKPKSNKRLCLFLSSLYQTLVHIDIFRYFTSQSKVQTLINNTQSGQPCTHFFLPFHNRLHIYQVFGYKSKWNQNSYWLLYSLSYNGNWTKKNISGCQCRTNGWVECWQFEQSGGCREGLGFAEQQQVPAFPGCSCPSPAHSQPAAPKNPGPSAGLLPPPCTPCGESPQTFLWCRITVSNIQLKTGNTPDTSADTEKQKATFPEPWSSSLTFHWFQL